MGPGDKPDSLTPAERHQYEENYVPRKLREGVPPKTPLQWREASMFWHARWLQGKRMEKGLDVVFGLTQSGWQREVPRKVGPVAGKEIRVDFYHDGGDQPPAMVQNVESKSGALGKERDVQQLEGYLFLLRRGEVVHLFTRAERDREMSKEARSLLTVMKAQYPETFHHRAMSERAYQRIMEAGARALERERRQELAAHVGLQVERDGRDLSIAEIARAYEHEAPTAGIEQLRFMVHELRDMANTQAVAERDIATEEQKKLGLRFQVAKELELQQKTLLAAQNAERQDVIDRLAHILVGRERELIDRGTQEAARELQRQMEAGRIDLEQARQQFHSLAYALGQVEELERGMEREAAARSPEPAEALAERLQQQENARQAKDKDVSRQIGAIGAVVEHETGRRERAELLQLAVDVNREKLIAKGISPEQARLQAPAMPLPVLRPDDRGRDPAELARELPARDREEAQRRQQAMDAKVAALVEKGVPRDAAKAAVLARLSSPGTDFRSEREKEVQRVEAQLLALRVPPEIARAAAEGRVEEAPQVTRAHAAEDRARERERDRGIERGR